MEQAAQCVAALHWNHLLVRRVVVYINLSISDTIPWKVAGVEKRLRRNILHRSPDQ
jgi:hypothetical protein